jgi:alpha-mannosidase
MIYSKQFQISGLLLFVLLQASVITEGQQKKIYIAPDDHTDYMWTANEAEYRQAFLNMLDYYINLNNQTSNELDPYRSKWNCDGSYWVYEYRKNRSPQQFIGLIDQIKKERITIPLNTLICSSGISPLETVVRSMYYAGSLEREFGLNLDLAIMMEDQVMPLGMASIWAGSGAKYSWHGVCNCATKVTGLNARQNNIYWYKGIDEQKVLMKWYSLTGFNDGLGGYAEARDQNKAVTRCIDLMKNSSVYPYSISGAFGIGWDNLQTTTNSFITAAKNNSNSNYQVIVSNEIDFFKDFEQTYGANLPSETVSYGNEWGNLVASLAEVSARVKRSTEKLRTAEALSSYVTLENNTFATDLDSMKELAWISCGLYFEHDWTTDGGAITKHERATWQRKIANQFSTYVDTLYNRSLKSLERLIIKPNTSNEVFFVFNQLGWERNDYCDYKYVGNQNIHVIDRTNSSEVPFQFVTLNGIKYLRILAEKIPSVGYKTYEIVNGPSSLTNEDAATVSANTIENSLYKITFTRQGVITSLLDKTDGNREYVKAFNNLYANDLGSGNGENGQNLSIENAGPVSVTLSAGSDLPVKHTSRLTLYSNSDRITLENRISQNFSSTAGYSFSFNLSIPDIWHEETGAILNAKPVSRGGHYAESGNRVDWLTLNHFADMTGNGRGVTISNRDSYLMKTGNSTVSALDYTSPQITALSAGQIDADKGLGISNQDGDSYFENFYALRTHNDQFNAALAMKFSLEHQNPMVSGKVTGNSGYPSDKFSLVNVSDSNFILLAFKPAEEGISHGLILRLWNMANEDRECNLKFGFPLSSALTVTHIETNISSLSLEHGSINTTVGHNMVKSFRVFMDTITGIEKESIYKPINFDIYPNPLKENELTFRFPFVLDSPDISLFDMSGKLVLNKVLAGKQDFYSINMPTLFRGEYFVQIKEKNLVVFKNKVLIKQ